jgi:hypothetical protein
VIWQWKSFQRATEVALFLQQIGDERAKLAKIVVVDKAWAVFFPAVEPTKEDPDGRS